MKNKITTDNLHNVRWEIINILEHLGLSAGLLREAISDVDGCDNVLGAIVVAEDVLETFSEIESKLNEMSVEVAKWVQAASEEVKP